MPAKSHRWDRIVNQLEMKSGWIGAYKLEEGRQPEDDVVESGKLEEIHRWQLGNRVNEPWDEKGRAWSPQIEGKTVTAGWKW